MSTPYFRNITLELSCKPFRRTDDAAIEAVLRRIFRQWDALTRDAETISLLFWTADGSEILEYTGDLDAEIEWARYIGGCNHENSFGGDIAEPCLHNTKYLYMDNPPVITYRTLRRIIAACRRVGRALTDKSIRIGATYDPGPEFAVSAFKYHKHPEICTGDAMGAKSFTTSYATLNADPQAYAGFPQGIPQDTPLGTFLGRQSRCFLRDLGFDYIWFSNGFGFGRDTWGAAGAVFDGERFHDADIAATRARNLEFWRYFRAACPEFPIETRGTNMSTGMDLASDAVDLRSIYQGGFNMAAPPNSPWAAMDHNFGLELVGYLSRIAELPDGGDDYPFRFYTHDPWWLNSPWLDRYGRAAHDIYLPLSCCRVNAAGATTLPTSLSLLTIDDSYGQLPDKVANETTPHIQAARAAAPDRPGPFVWIYPFDEYHDRTFAAPTRAGEVFFGDWFMTAAINGGLPVNTVVSTANFLATLPLPAAAGQTQQDRPSGLYDGCVLIAPVPDAGTELSAALLAFARQGGDVLLYGPIAGADSALRAALNLADADGLEGECRLDLHGGLGDYLAHGDYPRRIHHRSLLSGGPVTATLAAPNDAHTHVAAVMAHGDEQRVLALHRQHGAGRLAWVRGGGYGYLPPQAKLLTAESPADYFGGQLLMRFMLTAFGYDIRHGNMTLHKRPPIINVARHDNGHYLAIFTPETTVATHLRFPAGAPLLIGYEAQLVQGRAVYHFPRADHRECRIFVDQRIDGEISCTEQAPVEYGIRRRVNITGLREAMVRFYPPHTPNPFGKAPRILLNSDYPYAGGDIAYTPQRDAQGHYLEVADISGRLTLAW